MAKIKNKERIQRQQEKKKVNYKGTPIKLLAEFSTETVQTRREWQDIFKVLRGENKAT